jgi:hypothetical protein
LLNRLDEVMHEATRLRGEINRQLQEQRITHQPRVVPSRPRRLPRTS